MGDPRGRNDCHWSLTSTEVTGQLALQSFVETLCDDSETARRFRQEFTMYVVPMMNPIAWTMGIGLKLNIWIKLYWYSTKAFLLCQYSLLHLKEMKD